MHDGLEAELAAQLTAITAEHADLIRPGLCRGTHRNGKPCKRPVVSKEEARRCQRLGHPIPERNLCRAHADKARRAKSKAPRRLEPSPETEEAMVVRFLHLLKRLIASYRAAYPETKCDATFDDFTLAILVYYGWRLSVNPSTKARANVWRATDRHIYVDMNPEQPDWLFAMEVSLAYVVHELEGKKVKREEFPAFRAALRLVWEFD
ncbi:MAG: hypothetical protein AMXMBFR33_56340 [Candidatus Xenobia bacterium]